jgi:excisionase family DNA binding protein
MQNAGEDLGHTGLLTVAECARSLALSRYRLWQLIREHRLSAERVGRNWLIEPSVLRAFAGVPRNVGRPRAGGASKHAGSIADSDHQLSLFEPSDGGPGVNTNDDCVS